MVGILKSKMAKELRIISDDILTKGRTYYADLSEITEEINSDMGLPENVLAFGQNYNKPERYIGFEDRDGMPIYERDILEGYGTVGFQSGCFEAGAPIEAQIIGLIPIGKLKVVGRDKPVKWRK
jgi:hypothetical protein